MFLALVREQLDLGLVMRLAEELAGQRLKVKKKKARVEHESRMARDVDLKLHHVFEALPATPSSYTPAAQTESEQQAGASSQAVPHLKAELLQCIFTSRKGGTVTVQLRREEEVPQQQQWEMQEVACRRQDLEALNAPRAANAPLPIQPLLLGPTIVLNGLCQGASLEHCYLLRSVLQ